MALPPLERLQASQWAALQYVLALVHLDHAYGIGARLSLAAFEAAADELTATCRELSTLARHEDVEDVGDAATRFAGYADQLEEVSFEPR